MADKQDLLLTDEEMARALEGITMFRKYNLSNAITPSDKTIAKAQLAKAEKYYAGKIEEAKERGLEAGAINERARIIKILVNDRYCCPDVEDSLGYCGAYKHCEECFGVLLKEGEL